MPFPRMFPRPRVFSRTNPKPAHVVKALPLPGEKSPKGYIDASAIKIQELRKARAKANPLRAPTQENAYPQSIPDLPKTAPERAVLRLRMPGREAMVLLSIIVDAQLPNIFWDHDSKLNADIITSYLYLGDSVQEIVLNSTGFMLDFPSKENKHGGIMLDKSAAKLLLKSLLRSRHRLQEAKSAEYESETRAGKKKYIEPAQELTARYIDFSIEMPLNDPDHERTGLFNISMAGSGEAHCDATWFRLIKDKEGEVRPNFEVQPIMTWLDVASDNIDRARKAAKFKFEMSTTTKEREEARAEIEAIIPLQWGFKGSIKGKLLVDAIAAAMRQAAINQVDTAIFKIGISAREKGMIFLAYKEPGEDDVIIGYIKPEEWQGFKTGIDVPVQLDTATACYFDLYDIDRWVSAPVQAFARKWSYFPNIHVALPSIKGDTPAIIIYPIGSASYIAVVLANHVIKKKGESD